MDATRLDLNDAFAPVTAEAWRALVERDLKGAPFDKRLVTRLLEGIDLSRSRRLSRWNPDNCPPNGDRTG